MRTSFNMSAEDITMVKGDTLSFGMEITGNGGQDLDSAYFTIKAVPEDNPPLVQKSLGNGITKVDDGKYVVRVAPADTADLTAGRYYYDLQIGMNTDIYTVMIGLITLMQDVTTNGGA